MIIFQLEILLRLLLAAVLGGIIGAERERLNRDAGLRTHALVSTASALIVVVSAYGFMDVLSPGRVVLDPSRIAAQVISGVGFLGAGIIIFRKNAVRGLTTAATIWAVASIGLACGAGLYVAALGATFILSMILIVLKRVELKCFPQRQVNRFTVELANGPGYAKTVSGKFKRDGLKILSMMVKKGKVSGRSTIKVEALGSEKMFVSLFEELQAMIGVESVEYSGHALAFEDDSELDTAIVEQLDAAS